MGDRHHKHRIRTQAEEWIEALVADVRNGGIEPAAGSALHTMSWHRDLRVELLDLLPNIT